MNNILIMCDAHIKNSKLTYKEIAECSKIDPNVFYRWRHSKNPTIETLKKLSGMLMIPLASLCCGELSKIKEIEIEDKDEYMKYLSDNSSRILEEGYYWNGQDLVR